jgi:hypothetical protein
MVMIYGQLNAVCWRFPCLSSLPHFILKTLEDMQFEVLFYVSVSLSF